MHPKDSAVLHSLLVRMQRASTSIVADVRLALQLLGAPTRGTEPPPSRDGVRNDLTDETRCCVRWEGVECQLGPTILFRLFLRLARSRNQFVSVEELLDGVWGTERSDAAVRSAVRQLRQRLVAAGMAGLADAIHGSQGHYCLRLAPADRPPSSHRNRTRIAQRSHRPPASSPPAVARSQGHPAPPPTGQPP